MSPPDSVEIARQRIDDAMQQYPTLRERIPRALLITLHQRGLASVDEIYAQARGGSDEEVRDDNVQSIPRLDQDERMAVWMVVRERACRDLTLEQIDDVILLTRKREEAQSLEEIASLPAVSFGLIVERVKKFCRLPVGQTTLSMKESVAARVALIRHFISDQLEFIGLARRFLTIRHFDDLVDRIIGSDSGMGRVGGKAAGVVLAKAILDQARREDPDAPEIPIELPASFYLRSDVLEEILRKQGLWELQDHKYRTLAEVREDYPVILKLLKNADFPEEIVAQLSDLLEQVGEHPLIVRSSSLLEDRFGTAFAGKYRSVFLANQGSHAERLRHLLGAIAEVYASTLHPDPISYRSKRELIDYDENMAVLIQRVVGKRNGPYFFPVWAGVGFSLNEYRRSPRVKPEDGMARLVLGLGTRAVDRTGADCPRVMALGLPSVRAEVKPEDMAHYSQHQVDVINVEKNRFETVPLVELLSQEPIEGIESIVSIYQSGMMRRPPGKMILASPEELVVTFDRFAGEGPYPALLRWMLQALEKGYGCPVDVEFAFDGERFFLLQCRPQSVRKAKSRVQVPTGIPEQDCVFSASRNLQNDAAHGIEYVVLIDPRDYDTLHGSESRQHVARIVRDLNEKLESRVFALMGPGRWGSKDERMGVRVGYADINHARALIEIVRRRGSMVPEVSFGSHFFQDLVEADILYLPLYPDEEENLFDESFLHGSKNLLLDLLPEAVGMESVVRVIDVRASASGRVLNIDVDGEEQHALGYLAAGQV